MKIEWKTCAKLGMSVFALFLCIYYWESAAGILSAVISVAYPLAAALYRMIKHDMKKGRLNANEEG